MQNEKEKKEYNLIDLFVVFVKFRKIILVFTLCAVVITVIGYFIYPEFIYNKQQKKNQIEMHMRIDMTPVLSSLDIEDFSLEPIFNRPTVVLSALLDSGYTELVIEDKTTLDLVDPAMHSKALKYIQTRYIKNISKTGKILDEKDRIFYLEETANGIDILFKGYDIELIKAFLQSLFSVGNEELVKYLVPYAKTVVSGYERLQMSGGDGDIVFHQSLGQSLEVYDISKKILSGENEAIIRISDMYAFEEDLSIDSLRRDYIKRGIIIVLFVFFVTVFVAFILQYIDSIKSDEESMKKIKAALKKK